jgi:hypothetical protein
MADPIIYVDGVGYALRVRQDDLKRTASILDGSSAGRMKSGAMDLDTIGTFYNYSLTIVRDGTSAEAVAAYDALYEVLTDPDNREHEITIPYGQGTITYDAYVATIDDSLHRRRGGANYWNDMKVNFIAMRPYRTPT